MLKRLWLHIVSPSTPRCTAKSILFANDTLSEEKLGRAVFEYSRYESNIGMLAHCRETPPPFPDVEALVASGNRRNNKVEKRARLRGQIIPRWMQRIESKSLVKPLRKDDLQAPTLNKRFDSKFQELCNTVTGEADCVNGRNIAEQ